MERGHPPTGPVVQGQQHPRRRQEEPPQLDGPPPPPVVTVDDDAGPPPSSSSLAAAVVSAHSGTMGDSVVVAAAAAAGVAAASTSSSSSASTSGAARGGVSSAAAAAAAATGGILPAPAVAGAAPAAAAAEATTEEGSEGRSKRQTPVADAAAMAVVPAFYPSQKFATIQDLILAMERHAHERGFRYAKSFTYINGTKVVHRGKFKCQRHKRGQKDTKETAAAAAASATVLGHDGAAAAADADADHGSAVPAAASSGLSSVNPPPPPPHIACDFLVTFSGVISKGANYPACYVVRTVHLDHGHELDPPRRRPPSAGTAKTAMADLTSDEMDVVRECHRHHDAAGLAHVLQSRYGFLYAPPLMEEARSAVLEELYGDARDGLRSFLEFGYRTTSATPAAGAGIGEGEGGGGGFFVLHRHDLTFEAAAYQSPDMQAVHRAYRDHVIQDGALVTNVLGLSLVPTLVVDGLGRIAISSIVVAPIDSSSRPLEAVLEGIGCFGSKNDGNGDGDNDDDERTTYTTNRLPVFDKVAQTFGLRHIININAQIGDIDRRLTVDATARNLFRRLCYDVLTATDDKAQVRKELADLKGRYQNNPDIIKHVLELEANQTKLCRAYTGRYFTGGSYAPAGASAGSVVKEALPLSKEIKKQNIFELALDLSERFSDYKAKTTKELSGLIRRREEWSNIVASHWKTEVAESSKYQSMEGNGEYNGVSVIVSRRVSEEPGPTSAIELLTPSDTAGPPASIPSVGSADHSITVKPGATTPLAHAVEKTHLVRLPAGGDGIPKCDCTSFLSTKMPCRHICCALSSRGETNPCQLKYLAHRWRLQSHPFYLEASREEWTSQHPHQRGDNGITGAVAAAAAAVAGMGEHFSKKRKIEI